MLLSNNDIILCGAKQKADAWWGDLAMGSTVGITIFFDALMIIMNTEDLLYFSLFDRIGILLYFLPLFLLSRS